MNISKKTMEKFVNVKTLEELKAVYLEAFLKYKKTDTLEILNGLYIDKFEEVKNYSKNKAGKVYEYDNPEMCSYFLNCVQYLKTCEGIEAHMDGKWLWVTGETKKNKEALKGAGCWYHPEKKVWYLKPQRG